MTDDQGYRHQTTTPAKEVLAKCETCGQLYDRGDASQVRYHAGLEHKPRQRHNLKYAGEIGR